MTTHAQTRANRLNALRSTGPRSITGKRRSALNALRTGLFARHLIVAALEETTEEFESFARSVVADLAPVCAVGRELAERVATILWRLRRVARHEVAVMKESLVGLPPDPSEVTDDGIDTLTPLPRDASTAMRLAYVRAGLRSGAFRRSNLQVAIQALAHTTTDLKGDLDKWVVRAVFREGTAVLGWSVFPDPWPDVITAAGCPRECVDAVSWNVYGLRRVLQTAAEHEKVDPDQFITTVLGRLQQDAMVTDRHLVDLRAEEAKWVDHLVAEREQLAAAALYRDEAFVQRICRAESHLSRELERALDLLEPFRVTGGDSLDQLGSFCR